jgi:MinD-like ATPase involved in chromosome partitioning or flagellar assembly
MKSLRLINNSLQTLSKKFEVDYVIFDTSPGFQYSSVNAIISSDVAVLVTTPDRGDVEGTSELIKGVYETLERKTGIIVNKVPTGGPSIDVSPRTVKKFNSIFRFPVIEAIPCSCDVLSLVGESIFVQQHPSHPIVKHLTSVVEKLKKF